MRPVRSGRLSRPGPADPTLVVVLFVAVAAAVVGLTIWAAIRTFSAAPLFLLEAAPVVVGAAECEAEPLIQPVRRLTRRVRRQHHRLRAFGACSRHQILHQPLTDSATSVLSIDNDILDVRGCAREHGAATAG